MADLQTGIYKITSPSGKVYIGQSRDIQMRWNNYRKLKACKSQIALYNSFIKYGVQNHIFQNLINLPSDVSQETLNNYELQYWKFHKDCNVEMLNIREPGIKGRHSEETRMKMSKNMLGNKINLGRKMDNDTKNKIGISNSKKISQFTLQGDWIRDFNSTSEASNILGIKRSTISMCICGKNKRAGDFIFRRYDN